MDLPVHPVVPVSLSCSDGPCMMPGAAMPRYSPVRAPSLGCLRAQVLQYGRLHGEDAATAILRPLSYPCHLAACAHVAYTLTLLLRSLSCPPSTLSTLAALPVHVLRAHLQLGWKLCVSELSVPPRLHDAAHPVPHRSDDDAQPRRPHLVVLLEELHRDAGAWPRSPGLWVALCDPASRRRRPTRACSTRPCPAALLRRTRRSTGTRGAPPTCASA